jgi:anti-anti-sigma factor
MTELAHMDIERQEHSLVAHLQGEVDRSNAGSLERDIIAATPNTTAGVVLELSEVDYIDSSGIRMLFTIHKQLEQRGQHLRVVAPDTTRIKRVLDCLGVDAVVPVDADLSVSLAQLAQ